ncbi:MAG: hypothetical protein Q9177_000807 [Variospora cf. flavescens]
MRHLILPEGGSTTSPYEASWFASIETAQSNICEAVAKPEHKNASEIIVTRTLELTSLPSSLKWETYDTFNTTSFHSSDSFMSRMHYNRTCYDSKTETFKLAKGKGIQLIEPLWGMLRDPFDHCSLRPSSDPRVGVAFQPPQNIHLDLGSSYFKVWGSDRGAASGQWFYDTYHARGQPFSRFIAVEVETLNDTTAFQQIPDDLVGVYTLMNVGLTMEEGDKLNTVDMIKRVVKPEDFFVFKLDIDSAPIEEPIVKSLLEDNPDEGGASALIDELVSRPHPCFGCGISIYDPKLIRYAQMFEHHVNYSPMNGPWDNPQGVGGLHRSYNVFRDLRRKGIRAHSWP